MFGPLRKLFEEMYKRQTLFQYLCDKKNLFCLSKYILVGMYDSGNKKIIALFFISVSHVVSHRVLYITIIFNIYKSFLVQST